MNSEALLNQQHKSPLWRIILIISLFAVILFSILAYQKWKTDPEQLTKQSALLSQQQFILSQADAINTNWLRTLNPLVKNSEGRLVWSNTLQKGIMEFNALPKIAKNQHYQLWIYDLIGKDSKPILSLKFNKISSIKPLIPFTTKEKINSPFKFELLLKTEGDETSQPLFLAQP